MGIAATERSIELRSPLPLIDTANWESSLRDRLRVAEMANGYYPLLLIYQKTPNDRDRTQGHRLFVPAQYYLAESSLNLW